MLPGVSCCVDTVWGCAQAARAAAQRAQSLHGGAIPSYPGLRQRVPSSICLPDQELGGSGAAGGGSSASGSPGARRQSLEEGSRDSSPARPQLNPSVRSAPSLLTVHVKYCTRIHCMLTCQYIFCCTGSNDTTHRPELSGKFQISILYSEVYHKLYRIFMLSNFLCVALCREPRLYVCSNGQGSPCLDLRRVPETLADATVGTDLVIIEGMGRAIHTNYR